MKFLIGTLYSGENEFYECLESIEKQKYIEFEHKIFSHLPNREAHISLYKYFMDNSNFFDAFIKVDADMIIEDPLFLRKLNMYLSSNSDISRLIIPVFDYYTDKNIWGVNIYRNYVKWDLEKREEYFVDRIQIESTIKRTHSEYSHFDKAISHCKNPNSKQTYMYGYHRTLKAFQPEKMLPRLAPFNWKQFYYIFHKKMNNNIYENLFCGIYDALTIKSSEKFNSYNLLNEKVKSKKKTSAFFRFLFVSFHPYVSYILVYIFIRIKLIGIKLINN